MRESTAVLCAEYRVYVRETDTNYTVSESGDSPTLTEIIQADMGNHDKPVRISIENEHLPKLIEALQRRYADCKKDPEA